MTSRTTRGYSMEHLKCAYSKSSYDIRTDSIEELCVVSRTEPRDLHVLGKESTQTYFPRSTHGK